MLTAIIATHESERALVPTLAALVPGATAGLIAEVIVADAGSRDGTAEVADVAGCRFIASPAPLGARLREAAVAARTPWLMFLRPGCVPAPGWVTDAEQFIETGAQDRAAIFGGGGRVLFGGAPKPDRGLLIAHAFYDALGRHPDGPDTEAALLRRLGRRRIALLASAAIYLT